MQKRPHYLFTLILLIILLGCSSQSGEPEITGYVMDKTDSRILVASSHAQDLSDNGGVNEFYDMIWFSNAPETVELGDKIHVWYDNLNESYPAQSSIQAYEIVKPNKPEGAKLTEAEAIQKALQQQQNNASEDFAIHALEYDELSATWSVKLKEIWSEEVLKFEFKD